MINIAVFGATVSYVLMNLSHIVLRRREPDLERPYRTPGGDAHVRRGARARRARGHRDVPGRRAGGADHARRVRGRRAVLLRLLTAPPRVPRRPRRSSPPSRAPNGSSLGHDPRRTARGRGRRNGGHRAAGVLRHAGPAAGQATRRRPLPRRRRRARRGRLQLPARRRRRHEHGRRLRDVVVVHRLRRLRAQARPRHAAARAVARGDGHVHGRHRVARRLRRRRVAAPDPAPPARPPVRARLDRAGRHGARVHRLPRHLRGGLAEGLPRPRAGQLLQRRLLDARHVARGAADRPDPARDGARRPARRELQGRVQLRPARDQLHLRGRARRRRHAHDLQERREGDRQPGGHGDHLHGQVRRARGQLVPHPPVAARAGRRRSCSATSPSCSTASSPASSPACAS